MLATILRMSSKQKPLKPAVKGQNTLDRFFSKGQNKPETKGLKRERSSPDKPIGSKRQLTNEAITIEDSLPLKEEPPMPPDRLAAKSPSPRKNVKILRISPKSPPAVAVAHKENRQPSPDSFEDSFFDDIPSPVKVPKIQLPSVTHVTPARSTRSLKITQVVENFEKNQNLIVGHPPDDPSHPCYVLASGSWRSTKPEVGEVINVFGEFRENLGEVDDSGGLIVTHPEHLVPITTITSGFFCQRKAYLQSKYKKLNPTNAVMLQGIIAHEVFQRAVCESLDRSGMVAVLTEIMGRFDVLHDISVLDIEQHEVKAAVLKLLPHISSFINENVNSMKKQFRVTQIHDIEDNLLCPRLGVRGKIDMTVAYETKDGKTVEQAPFELKTGKPSFSQDHVGQVLFYTMMINEKTGREMFGKDDKACKSGILSYVQQGNQCKVVPAGTGSLQALMQRRNELAGNIAKLHVPKITDTGIELNADAVGPFKEEERFCSSCSCRTACSVYASMADDLPKWSVREKIAAESFETVTPDHLAYVTHWIKLLDCETYASAKRKPFAFWMTPMEARVASGDCVSGLKIIDDSVTEPEGNQVRRTVLTLQGDREIGLADGSYVAISEEGNESRVANRIGFIGKVEGNSLTLDLDYDVGPGAAMDTTKTYCVDLLHSLNIFNAAYTNVMRLLSPQNRRFRDLIIDLQPPKFQKDYPWRRVEQIEEIFSDLNDIQVRTVVKSLMAEDYLLIKGMPGTGKTTVIVAIVRALLAINQRVLLTSYTHNALDNILERLDAFGVDYVRIGKTSNATIRKKTAQVQLAGKTNVNEIKHFYKVKRVFAATCLGVDASLFEREKFDVCIVDEASQVIQPICLGPVLLAKKFLLVGDPDQLSAVVQSTAATKFGMDECLFKRLEGKEECPQKITLNRQYRMNEEIMALCNGLVYENGMQCGNEKVAKQTLKLKEIRADEEWLRRCVSSDLRHSVVFIDLKATEETVSTGVQNSGEANVIKSIVDALIERDVARKDIGVIAPYRAQVELLKKVLPLSVEVSTVDRYQGKEKEIVLFSCVRTQVNESSDSRTIVNDIRRLNVAVSRARTKFIAVGHRQAMGNHDTWRKLFSVMREDQFVEMVTE